MALAWPSPPQPDQLWLPLDLLESHLGFRRVQGQLRWFGRRKQLADVHQISLGDEVALEVADWLLEVGVNLHRNGPVLEISLPRHSSKGCAAAKATQRNGSCSISMLHSWCNAAAMTLSSTCESTQPN